MKQPIRIAMWSGPRNISTAMMRSFGARGDTAVVDEPFYACYLAKTGLNHPMREAVLASQPADWRVVVQNLLSAIPGGREIYYQKHMTHHMLPEIGREWLRECRNAFLIRDPRAVLASYVRSRGDVELSDIGIVQQRELFDREADRLGRAPPVVESVEITKDPKRTLSLLCAALDIAFDEAMLSWPPGRRDTDGVWAPAWYATVEKSTCFAAPTVERSLELTSELERIADQAQPHYEALSNFKIR